MFAKTTRFLTALAALIIACSMAVPISGMLGIVGSPEQTSPTTDGQITQTEPRSVDYRWYDMFNVPFGEWWNTRWSVYHGDEPLSDSYPYIFRSHKAPLGNDAYMSNMRLDIMGRNMTELNMNSHPEFLPYLGTERGGTAAVIWYMQYMTAAELQRYPGSSGWNDGWVVSLNGTAILDQQATEAVLGLDPLMWDDFGTWWSSNNATVTTQYGQWLVNEAGPSRLDIYPMYDYYLLIINLTLTAERIGDYVFLSYNTVSWGMEALMARWLHEAFMPSEWFFEDMVMIASIGPDMADLDITTAVDYPLVASEPVSEAGVPCWTWEGMMGDFLASSPPEHPHSDFDPYVGLSYIDRSPGNAFYGQWNPYDHTPGAFNLSANETMMFEWPAGPQLFKVQDALNPTEALNYTAEMIVDYSEPMHTDNAAYAPGAVYRDNNTRQLVFIGPIDVWTWSKDQTAHANLSDEWSRLGVLPYGMPYIEFRPAAYVPRWAASLEVAGIPMMPIVDVPVDICLAVRDNVGAFYPDYTGTVHFSTDRPGEVYLPPDYTFVPADAGIHTFLGGATFLSTGNFTVTCEDVSDPSINGSDSAINVVAEAPRADHFDVVIWSAGGGPFAGEMNNIYVYSEDQYGMPYPDYRGTVTFSTNASVGTYVLPSNYTFTSGDNGTAMVTGLVWTEAGTYNLTVTDTSNSSLRGSAEYINVTVRAVQQHIDYRVYDMFEQRWGDWWPWRLTGYKTDILLNNKPHEYTMVYNPDTRNMQGIIYAPYRWNTSATGVSTVDVHHPEFMPTLGTPDVPGAAADMHLWFQYLDNASWNGYWKPTWGTNPGWLPSYDGIMPPGGISGQFADGYYLGVLYTVKMNREAALEWLGMPLTDVPDTWWSANGATYMQAWRDWILDEGNVRLDIWPAYEYTYVDIGTMMDLVEEPTGDVTLSIGHFSWGFEALITRWLNETGICIHEPYMEDFNLSARFENTYADVYFDAVAQYNLHAVKANGTVDGAAWVWEPQRIDYASYDNPLTGYTSEFNPWELMYYESWNAGDGYFGDPFGVPYDFTPQWFNLTDYQTLTFQLPTRNDVIGYVGQGLPTGRTSGAIYNLKMGNPGYYENITIRGAMWLGWYMTGLGPGAPDLSTMYNNFTKTLYMVGPMDFDNYHFWNGLLYHSAPWIEFDVSNGTPPDLPPVADAGSDQLVMAGESVLLNGTMSYDDFGIVNWTWTIDLGGSSVILFGEMMNYVFTSEGVYNVTLTVRDTLGQTNSTTIQVTVSGVIPEFGSVFMTAIGLAMLVVLVAGVRRRRD